MSRILTLLSIILLVASGWFVYSNGILGQVFNPTVVVLTVNEDIRADRRIRAADVSLQERPITEITGATITFPREVSQDVVSRFLQNGKALASIRAGTVIDAENFGQAPQIWQVRLMNTVGIGDPIESNLLDVIQTDTPEPGTLVFITREEANAFIANRTSLRASRLIEAGRPLSVDDFGSGDGGAVYVLETTRALTQGNVVTAADVRATILPSTEIPRGAISFPSRAGADIFITASNALSASADFSPGTVLTADMLRPGSTRVLRDIDAETVPETFEELVQLQSLAPLEIKFLNLLVDFPDLDVKASVPLIGSVPREGLKMDLWVEVENTAGPFGTIRLRRFIEGIDVRQVVDPDLVLSSRERRQEAAETEVSGATPPVADDETPAAKGVFYWANVTRAGGLAFEEAATHERMAFLMASSTPISDFLGNGVICREDFCTVSRNISNNMELVRGALALAEGQELEGQEEEVRLAPFSILDGVSVELEAAMHAEGYETFEDVARWEDGQINIINFQLGITRNLAIYIREQAVTIVNMPTNARQQLGITGTPGIDMGQ